ncbi:MAG: ATP-binding protein [Bacteroidia bacterium]|nr:ATP-binding protein [Bacteroidia bacterium]
MQKKLPIGVQEFSKLIKEEYLYVDKTEIIYNLINQGIYYFLSRPRRFGKSLMISILKEIFQGNQELFEGLWIHDKMDWEACPVIHLDFSKMSEKTIGLQSALESRLAEIARENKIDLVTPNYSTQFDELIRKLGSGKKVAILVDEYDKPIIDHVDDPDKADHNREVLKNLYSVVKGNDKYIRFFLLTGVSKFSQVSIFSDLNNLNDISTDENYATLLGYTQQELEFYFKEFIPVLAQKYADYFPDILKAIKEWYNGYSWDGAHFVYNPFSILNLFEKNVFRDYWFQTGTPTFLMKLIRQNGYSPFDLKNRQLNINYFNTFDLRNIELNALLFQTGYLTMKAFNFGTNIVTLDFPNREVEEAFSIHLLAEFSQRTKEQAGSILFKLGQAVEAGETETFVELMKSMFANITYPLAPVKKSTPEHQERYYHSIFYLCLKLLGYQIDAEIMTHDGRIDAVLQTAAQIWVIEFKLGTAESALEQIQEKAYHLKYTASDKKILLLGIGFSVESRNISDFQCISVK